MSFSGSGSGTGITLRGLVAELSRGLKVDYRSVWKFVHAETLSFNVKVWI
jgi:putative transposase